MSKSLLFRLRKTIISPAMLISVLLGVFMLTWFIIYNTILYNLAVTPLSINQAGSTYLNDIYNAHALTGFDLFAPILAVLPASTLFCDDFRSGYIKSVLCRIDRARYIKETVFCSSISGGLAVFLPSLIAYIFFICIGSPESPSNLLEGWTSLFDETVFANIQYIWGGIFFIVLLLILAFMFGACWSNFGLLVSGFVPNKYVALITPFAFYFAIHLILYRLKFPLLFSPVNLLMPVAIFIPNAYFPFVYQAFLLILFGFLFKLMANSKLDDI